MARLIQPESHIVAMKLPKVHTPLWGFWEDRPCSSVATFDYPAVGVLATLSVLLPASGARQRTKGRADLQARPIGSPLATFGDICRRPLGGMGRYQTLGLVWFGKAQNDGIYHRDWRIENDPQAVAVFRLGLSELNLAQP